MTTPNRYSFTILIYEKYRPTTIKQISGVSAMVFSIELFLSRNLLKKKVKAFMRWPCATLHVIYLAAAAQKLLFLPVAVQFLTFTVNLPPSYRKYRIDPTRPC